ncbi:MAG TPA: ATP-binding protein [Verrucomicrobiae bacterium]|nr:ATP-binding protein [Verrucomicrobiae bacterium]
MKIFKSIKWRLQIWYGIILTFTIVAGIAASYQMERSRQLASVDRTLHVQFQNLMNVLHPPRPHGGLPPEMQPPEEPMPGFPQEFRLPKEEVNSFFENTGVVGYYYVIWSHDGKELMRSTNAPTDLIAPNSWNPAQMSHGESQARDILQKHGDNYELIVSIRRERQDYDILIGHSILSELQELRRYLIKQIVNGLIILFAGLFVGHLLISSAIRPINSISDAAVKISAGDLAQRISIAETESELGQLAAVLNSTFARLETAFAQQKQFASDAAHELRTPVSVILTQTQTALNRERDAADYKQTVEACQRAARRMRKLIESLLELARLDAGQEILNRLNFDFSKTISDCAELVQPLADERNVKIISELSSLEITGDPERLAQVVTNLLTNAIQYNKAGGEVRVKLDSQNSLAILKISDTGTGISPADLPRVFERFYRADKSRTGGGNAGLGLSICKAIVEAHGGTIEVSSEENVGTTFTVRLPI